MVHIMRGVPGSGKTTYANKVWPDAIHASADHFFTGEDGIYRFNPAKLADAHAACLRMFVEGCQDNSDCCDIVVDNTTISAIEVAPYYAVAQAYGHSVEIVNIVCDPVVAAARNVHGVSTDKILRMLEMMARESARFPSRWISRTVFG